jgi:hypothetical protein
MDAPLLLEESIRPSDKLLFLQVSVRNSVLKHNIPEQDLEEMQDKLLLSLGLDRKTILQKQADPEYSRVKFLIRKLARCSFTYGLIFSMGFLVFQILLVEFMLPNPFSKDQSGKTGAVVFMLICAIIQLAHMIQTIVYFLYKSMHFIIPLRTVIHLYLSTIIGFAAIFALSEAYESNASFDISADDTDRSPTKLIISFLYFSAVTMGSIGFGDISPKVWHSILASMIAMFVSLCYRIVIFSIALVHLNIDKEKQNVQTNDTVSKRREIFTRMRFVYECLKKFSFDYHFLITFVFSLSSELTVIFLSRRDIYVFAFVLCGNSLLLAILVS